MNGINLPLAFTGQEAIFQRVSIGLDKQNKPGPEVIIFFLCSTQASTKFQMLIKSKIVLYRQMKKSLALSLSGVVFIMLINVKMPTIVGILTFMSMKKVL